MVVHDFYVLSTCNGPTEADPELIVYADAMLPGAIALEGFESVAWGHSEVLELSRDL